MKKIKFILCHGSGNKFVMFDAIKENLESFINADFVQKVCQCIACDGVLFAVRSQQSGIYQMRMFNTDGSEAEMCGNGIRCVARLINELYIGLSEFEVISGGDTFALRSERAMAKGVSTYSVEIPIYTYSDDFTLNESRFVGKRIETLDTELYFTYLNLGNPHIVALCENIDLEQLSRIGERVKSLKSIFPNGVNVSVMKYVADQKIYVATFERGVGLTPSCGTAMTASCSASVMLGVCREDLEVEVQNRGGAVYCTTTISEDGEFQTRLKGNATFDSVGEVSDQGELLTMKPVEHERLAWSNYLESRGVEL